jgi:AcrR family transcriptional regulator
MPSRRARDYKSPLREDAKALTRRRIVEATVALHAEKGPLATSHADIAERAGVSLPTVYNHFPNAASLLPHCMGAVAATLPPIDTEGILAEADPSRRIDRLVTSIYLRYERHAPWLRWAVADAPKFPELAAAIRERDRVTAQLVAAALTFKPHRRPQRDAFAIARALLEFTAWRRLTDDLGSNDAAIRAASAAIHAVHAPEGGFA